MPQLDVGTLKAAIKVDTGDLKKANREVSGLGLNIQDSFRNINRSLRNTGLIATAALSVPLAMFSANSVKAASDAVEMTNVFNVAFSSVRQDAEKTAKSIADDFDLAASTSKVLLGDIGDLLIGFGKTRQGALEMSNTVVRMAGDLVSYKNIAGGIPAATNAMFRGMLGVSQALKPLGIALNQQSKEFKALIREYMSTHKVTMQIARAHVVLNEIIKQSPNAIGDYKRTQNELANTTRRLGEMMKFLREEFGKILIQGLRLDLVMKGLGTIVRALAKTFSLIPGFLRPVIGGFVLLGITIPPVIVALAIFNLSVLHLQKNSIGLTTAFKLQSFFLNRYFVPSLNKAIFKIRAFAIVANHAKFSIRGLKASLVGVGVLFSGIGKWLLKAGTAIAGFASSAIVGLLAALAAAAGSVYWAFVRIKDSIPKTDIKFLSDLIDTLNDALQTTWRWIKGIGKTVVEVVKLAIDSMTKLLSNMIFNLDPRNMIKAIRMGNIGALNPFGGMGDIFKTFDKNMRKIAKDVRFPSAPTPPTPALGAGGAGQAGVVSAVPSLATAAIRGTSEAVRIETQRDQSKKVEENTKKTASNTKKIADIFENNRVVLMPANITA